jgi:protein-disulfide isomerase
MKVIALGIVALALVAVASAAEPPVATVGTHPITRAELETHVRPKLAQLERQRYDMLREGLDELIAEELMKQEAKARNITPDALEKQEITDKVPEPTDAEIQEVYDDNKDDLDNATLDSVKPRIVEYLKQQKAADRREAFLTDLKSKYKTTVSLAAPVVKVGTGGRAGRGGGPNAPVTIVAFSDYECPFCKRAESTVDQVMKTYGDKVRIVHRDFPLPIHAHARQASEAANCANAQGKFWEYHDKLFAADDLSDDKLKTLAGDLGLDRAKFDECFDKQQFKKAIDQDIADGTVAGVSGTPAFFINGHLLSGAQPFEKFKEVIDEELAHAKQPKS